MMLSLEKKKSAAVDRGCMKANVFLGPGKFSLDQKAIPEAAAGEAVVEVRLTTICALDVEIARGRFAVKPGLTLGHEAVGVIHQLGAGVTSYDRGQRVLVCATTVCAGTRGWKLGHTMDGAQAEYLLVPCAEANLAPIPDSLSDEQVLLLGDVASTGFAAAEQGCIRLGDNVAIFGQDPVGLCATLGAKLMGAAHIIAVDEDPRRLAIARQFGATRQIQAVADPVRQILELTEGCGVDVAIEALVDRRMAGIAARSLKTDGTLSSVDVHSGHDRLCRGGKERMRRLIRMVEARRVDLTPLFSHIFPLDEIRAAYELAGSGCEGVLKVAIRVH
jgi:threonine dehydrogenase-like Zn-dependent dehydrogenase